MSSKLMKKIKKRRDAKETQNKEIKTLSYYIDDRLELVKQIFDTLKPKTIKNLCPDFLKESDIEHIQEMCLNELLGISSKRLKSIIHASRCPSDTESSDSNREENISLEEISSDSDEENRKKREKVNKIGKTTKNNKADDENGQGTSVLELLELQARARAIRSQLALEPIAKVELEDSEDSGKKALSVSVPDRKLNKQKICKNNSSQSQSRTSSTKEKVISIESQMASKSNSKNTLNHITNYKPIKLRRNYGKQSLDNSASSTNKNNEKLKKTEKVLQITSTLQNEKQGNALAKNKNEFDSNRYKETKLEKSERKIETLNHKKQNEKRVARSPSPDVLAILPSPEILSVNGSSDDDFNKIHIKKEKLDDSVSDSEICSYTQSSNTSLSSEESDSEYSLIEQNQPEKMEDLRNLIQRKKIKEKESEIVMQKDEDILHSSNNIEGNKELEFVTINSFNNGDEEQLDLLKNLNKLDKQMNETVSQETEISLKDYNSDSLKNQTNEKQLLNLDLGKSVIDCAICNVESDKSLEIPKKILKNDEDQQNDDVISLGDAELDYGINDHIEERSNANINIPDTPLSPEVNQSEPEEIEDNDHLHTKTTDDEKCHDKTDYIDLHDSSGEEVRQDESNSWNDRWLKSSKVSKILAASKLGNKVRDKAKKNKKAEQEREKQRKVQEEQKIAVKHEISSQKLKAITTFEEGSMKQYEKIKEIVRSPRE